MTVTIVVDSTADLPEPLRNQYNITVVPLRIMFGPDTFHDGVDLSTDQFYARLTQTTVHPSTAEPSVDAFVATYTQLAQHADGIVSIHISSGLSATVNAARAARAQLLKSHPDFPMYIVDSRSVSMGCGFLALHAAKLARTGATVYEIGSQIDACKQHIRQWAVLDTLKYLERGGRIGRAQAFVGTLFNLKPMIQIARGEVLPVASVRSHPKALARLVELTTSDGPYTDLAVLHSVSAPLATELANQLGTIHPRDDIVVSSLTGVLGVHGGAGVVSVVGIKHG